MLGTTLKKFLFTPLRNIRGLYLTKCCLTQNLENVYSESEKEKILEIINSDLKNLSRYDIAKTRVKKLSQWFERHGKLKNIAELENIDGFTENNVKKFYNSILEGPKKLPNKIKGQIVHPTLTENVIQNCRLIVSLHVSFNSVSWTLIDRSNYELLKWNYQGLEHFEGKKVLMTEILDMAWRINGLLPDADIYVMKAESTSLRGGGSDPNNPKVLTVNLQKAQLIAMLFALINAKKNDINISFDDAEGTKLNQKVYFLRSTLPYRLYRILVGNENVSTDQAVQTILEKAKEICPRNSHVHVGEDLVHMFKSQKELQKDILGHSLLLGLTFMDLCIYHNAKSIAKLTNNDD
ncbi:uncharacterized protein [Battus philenor]|uniref:uncharacterized protein n=1 Tax=Battus philenor TaxID=42288 RepID=UPI0035D065B3